MRLRERFDDARMSLINEHLRNDTVWCCGTYHPGVRLQQFRSGGR